MVKTDKKSQYKTCILRNVGEHTMILKKVIFSQLGSSKRLDFGIGYVRNNCKIWIRDESDVKDVWDFVRKKESITLWCAGISFLSSDSDDDVDKPKNVCFGREKQQGGRNNLENGTRNTILQSLGRDDSIWNSQVSSVV